MTVKRRRYGKSGYGYTVDGEKVPGVTTILKQLPNDNLIKWAANATAAYALDHWDELSREPPSVKLTRLQKSRYEISSPAAKRGTEVHRLGAALSVGEEVLVPEELTGYVEAYRGFLDTIEPQPVQGATELAVASRTHRYCGTADLVADLPAVVCDGELIPACRWLLDLKTAKSGVWPENALQLCAYKHADVFVDPDEPDDERPMEWLQIARCGVVHIGSDDWELRPVDTGPEVWEFFQHLRWLHDQQDRMKEWVGGPVRVADLAPAPA
jgi:hypothetical protein